MSARMWVTVSMFIKRNFREKISSLFYFAGLLFKGNHLYFDSFVENKTGFVVHYMHDLISFASMCKWNIPHFMIFQLSFI